MTTNFYLVFDGKDRGARELIKSRLRAYPPVYSAARGDASGRFSAWAVIEASLSIQHGFWRYGLASRGYQALNVASNTEVDVLIAKVPRCAKRIFNVAVDRQKSPKSLLKVKYP